MAIENSTVARPYAKAAFEFAKDSQALTNWSEFLQASAVIASDKAVLEFLDMPQVHAQQQFELFNSIETELNEQQQNFIRLLAEADRLAVLPQIVSIFESLKDEFQKTAIVQVTSFSELNETQQQKLKLKLETRMGREVQLECNTDTSLLGGMIIQSDDIVIDSSLRTKLAEMATDIAA